MRIYKIKGFMVNLLAVLAAIAFSFPGVIGKIGKGGLDDSNRAQLTYSYSSPYYNVDVKDVRSARDIKNIHKELERSKVLGENYPGDRESVTHQGSLFIVKRFRGTYEIESSICWYGEKSDICLVKSEGGDNQYIEMTPELKKFLNSRFIKE